MTFAAILTLLSLGIGVLKLLTWGWDKLFSKSARFDKIQAYLEGRRVATRAARDRLKEKHAAIDAQPDKADQALADDLAKRLKDLE